MLFTFLLRNPLLWLIPWALQSFAYYFVLGKMGLRRWTCLISVLAEREFSKVLFKRMTTFYRAVIIALIFICGALYLGEHEMTSYVYLVIANIVYGFFLLLMYCRMAKSFGKKVIYGFLTAIIPPLFLLILGLGKSRYTPLVFKTGRRDSKLISGLKTAAVVLITAAEIFVILLAVGFWTVRTYPPRLLVNENLKEIHDETKDITADMQCLTREDAMGEDFKELAAMPASREHFFPDHSGDESVVVMEYIIGSNLEDNSGLASANIQMMEDASKQGSALTFVLQAGGSRRWFTKGMDDEGYGRLEIRDGKIQKVMDLDPDMCMAEGENLSDFIKWTKETYPADRYMLILWDHGGGIAYGYGQDQVNPREGEEIDTIKVSEIIEAVADSGVTFDIIGFDACLMQDLEIANALEPYADYYLASEEVEGGLGWYYTSAFGKLAAEPGMGSEEFGRALISSYDQFNRSLNDGNPQTDATLSLVDLTLVKQAADKVSDFFETANEAVRNDRDDFADIGAAASSAYTFTGDYQIDLIDFMKKLNDTDMDDSICPSEEKEAVINAVRACVVLRNGDSADGVNGMALGFPYKAIGDYSATSDQLKALELSSEKSLFDDVFSIIAYQRKVQHDSLPPSEDLSLTELISELTYTDYTVEDWYVEGFEDYDASTTLIDIPLTETDNGYKIELPEKTWNLITDCQTIVYQRDENGSRRFLGTDQIGDDDENGHPMIDMNDTWVHINGQLVSYQAEPVRQTDNGDIYSGKVKARLNDKNDIILSVEWDPVTDEDTPVTGRVTGYTFADQIYPFMQRGEHTLHTGDRIEFLFDYYDDAGKKISTEPYGNKITVTAMDKLKAEDKELGESDIEFLGLLTDVYQREYLTEKVTAHIGAE